ncbi:MAG: hypothetical protein LWW77_11600 [Propionibacteriales bacterium]|nr:hypothetical protein [Propionibacteriales bacterium]
MSTFQEPTNDELWAQPPSAPAPSAAMLPATPPTPVPPAPLSTEPRPVKGALALAISSLGIGIPLSAIASSTAGLPGLIVAWIGIVGVNVAFAWAQRRF